METLYLHSQIRLTPWHVRSGWVKQRPQWAEIPQRIPILWASPSPEHPQPSAAVRVHSYPSTLSKGDSFGPTKTLQDLASRGRQRCYLSWWEDGAELWGMLWRRCYHADVCADGSWSLSPFPISTAITDFCLSSLWVYPTISVTLIFNCLSPFLLLSGSSKQLIHPHKLPQETEQGQMNPHKALIRLSVPSLLGVLIYGDWTPSFQTNSHPHSMVQKMIQAKQVLNIKPDDLFGSYRRN